MLQKHLPLANTPMLHSQTVYSVGLTDRESELAMRLAGFESPSGPAEGAVLCFENLERMQSDTSQSSNLFGEVLSTPAQRQASAASQAQTLARKHESAKYCHSLAAAAEVFQDPLSQAPSASKGPPAISQMSARMAILGTLFW